MNLDEVADLISRFGALPVPPEPEPTIFGVGGRGYYENPTTDLLAFFCDPDAAHQFDTAVLETLFDCLDLADRPLPLQLSSPPVREQPTSGGRIDMLLEAEDWVLALENKIFHAQVNPFESYQSFVEEIRGDRRAFYVVLSPDGKAPAGWHGVSYARLLKKFRENMAPVLLENPVNKWAIYFRDFLLNLEQIVTNAYNVPEETIQFFLAHLGDLNAINLVKDQAVQSLQQDLHAWLSESLGEDSLRYKFETWRRFPALRFYRDGMYEKSSAVLYLDGSSDGQYCVQFFICGISGDQERDQADQVGLIFPDIQSSWDESSRTIRGYSRPLPDTDIDTIRHMLKEVLEKLLDFERNVRPSW